MLGFKKSDDKERNFEDRLKNCLKILENTTNLGTDTLAVMYTWTEQISRIHKVAADIDHDLSMGEKLLGCLGGIFSKTRKPKKTRPITAPAITKHISDFVDELQKEIDEREKLGLTSASKEPTAAMPQVEKKVKKDDTLSDISEMLGTLKNIALDMGCQLDRQNKPLVHVHDDVEELNFRMKGANQRTRHLLRK